MKTIKTQGRFTQVSAVDEPEYGAHHHYLIDRSGTTPHGAVGMYANIRFQRGPVKLTGVNGVHNEDLLAIVIDRLHSFQSGPMACRENALALTKLEEAMHWLNHRTTTRQDMNIEGTETNHEAAAA